MRKTVFFIGKILLTIIAIPIMAVVGPIAALVIGPYHVVKEIWKEKEPVKIDVASLVIDTEKVQQENNKLKDGIKK